MLPSWVQCLESAFNLAVEAIGGIEPDGREIQIGFGRRWHVDRCTRVVSDPLSQCLPLLHMLDVTIFDWIELRFSERIGFAE